MISITWWNVWGALFRANGFRISLNSHWWDAKAVLSWYSPVTSSCHYSLLTFSLENSVASPWESIQPSMWGVRYESRMVITLSLQYCTQNRGTPSFLGANTIGDAHSGTLGSVISITSTLSISCFSNSRVQRSFSVRRWMNQSFFRLN